VSIMMVSIQGDFDDLHMRPNGSRENGDDVVSLSPRCSE
jgi:hypothetical protein